MKTQHAPQPLSSHESAIPRNGALVALCALFTLLFGNPFAQLINELEALFAAWRAGTLPPVPVRAPAPQPAASPRRPRATARPTQRLRHRRPAPGRAVIVRAQSPRQPPRQRAGTHACTPPRARPHVDFFSKIAFASAPTHVYFVTIS